MFDDELNPLHQENDLPQRRWTLRRIIFLLIILITLIAFLLYVLSATFFPPPRPPLHIVPHQQA